MVNFGQAIKYFPLMILLLSISCSTDITSDKHREKLDSLNLARKESDLYKASIQLIKSGSAGNEEYDTAKKMFNNSLDSLLTLKRKRQNNTVVISGNKANIIIPVTADTSGSLIMPSNSFPVQWGEISSLLKGEVIDLKNVGNKLLALFPDSVSLIFPAVNRDSILTAVVNSDHSLRNFNAGSFLDNEINDPSTISFITSKLSSPGCIRLAEKPDCKNFIVDSCKFPGDNNLLFDKETGLFGSKGGYRSVKKIEGKERNLILDKKGYLFMTDSAGSLLWMSERPWGNRLFMIGKDTAAVTTGYDSSFAAFRIKDEKLVYLGKSPSFDGIVTAVSGSGDYIAVSVKQNFRHNFAFCKILSAPKNLLNFNPAESIRVPLYPEYNTKFVFAANDDTELNSRDSFSEIRDPVRQNVYETLFLIGNSANPEPLLVENFSSSENFKQWDFRIKRNIRFSDGSQLTAYDVVNSWQNSIKNADKKYPGSRWLWNDISGVGKFIQNDTGSISGIQIPDSFTVNITLENPVPEFIANLANPFFCISKKIGRNNYPAGTGAYQIEKTDGGKSVFSVSLKRNTFYHGPAAPIKELIFVYKTANPIDFLTQIQESGAEIREKEILRYFRKLNSFNVRRSEKKQPYFIAINPFSDALKDVLYREKIITALNKTETAKLISQAECFPAENIITNTLNNVTGSAAKKEKYPAALFSIYYFREDPVAAQIAERFSLSLTSAGIPHKNPVGLYSGSFQKALRSGSYDIIIDSFLPLYNNDVYNFLLLSGRGYQLDSISQELLNNAIRKPDKTAAAKIEKSLRDNFIINPVLTAEKYFIFPAEMQGIENSGLPEIDFSKIWIPVK